MKLPKETFINIAPLVDVMLVLLIIFMITAPMIQSSININLPKTKESNSPSTSKKNIILSITKNGDIYIDKTLVTFENMIQKIEELTCKDKTQVIQVKGDKNLMYYKVYKIMNFLVSSGYNRISLIGETETF